MKTETEDRHTHLDWQFCIAVYLKTDNKETQSHLFSEWSGIEFGNSWKAGIERAKQICAKNPEYMCVLIDRMNRKKPLDITNDLK